jgi:3-isopropylmalate dehydratase small subunit
LQAVVDLDKQEVVFQGTTPLVLKFDIEPGAKEQLIRGLDDIDQTLLYEADITRFEKEYDPFGQ